MKSLRELLDLMEDKYKRPPKKVMAAPDRLSVRQKVLKGIIMACDTQNDLDRFISGLPTPELQTEALNIVEYIVATELDKATQDPQSVGQAASYLGPMADSPQAMPQVASYLQKFQKK